MKKIAHHDTLATAYPAFHAGPVDAHVRSLPPQRRLMSVFVDCTARACAAQVAEAQSSGKQDRAFRHWPAEAIAALLDTGHCDYAKTFFKAFVRDLHEAERIVALENISAEEALTAVSEHTRRLVADPALWDELRYSLEFDLVAAQAAPAV